jgi:hopene-associated glycosyltransferase HpnB
MSIGLPILLVSAAIWLYLLIGRGGFWMGRINDAAALPDPAAWPAVTAIVPARNEAALIGETVASLAAQDYPGPFSIIIVDDQSSDGTAQRALTAAATVPRQVRVVAGRPLESGWTGKLFALQQGFEAACSTETATYLWLTDADIAYRSDALSSLVRRAETNGLVLTSLMARLRCVSLAERALIPAFIFFFQMLYPFAWVNRADRRVAAAAGGCMLVRREALQTAGGFGSIRDALIDDCALGARLKHVGPIWLGLTDRAFSRRAYDHYDDIRRMVARSAYAQLHYSVLYLAGTIVGLLLVFGLGPIMAIAAHGPVARLGVGLWALMALLFVPTLQGFRVSLLWSIALPLIAFIYLLFTLDSAYQHRRGYGGLWKGRVQATRSQ